jgi:hypothetical protein
MSLLGLASAAEITVNVASKELVVGQTVEMSISVIDGSPKGLPELPASPGLMVRYTGQAQQRVVSNFKSTRIVQFNYQLSAVQPGSWHLGPVDMIIDGQRRGAAPVTIHVGEAPVAQGRAPVVATLSDARPFLGEVVVYRLQYKRNRPVVGVEWTRPTFDGFIEEKIAEAGQREYQIVEDGEQFSIQTIEIPLVAASVGPYTVPPAVVTARYRAQRKQPRRRQRGLDGLFGDSPFFGRAETRNHTSTPLHLEIRALPEVGRPADFAGLVGRFTLSTEASTKTLRLGESVTLTSRLEGDGTLSGFRLPPAPSDAGFRAYDDTPEIVAKLQDGVFRSVAVIKRAVVPEAVGTLVVPGLQIPVFDPETEQYITLQTPPLQIVITPGEAGAGAVTSFLDGGADTRRAVESLGEDILPLTEPDKLENATLIGALPLIAGLPALPLLLWIALAANGFLASRRVDSMAVQRRRLVTLPAEAGARLAALEDIFREVAALRLGCPAPGLDVEAVAALGEEAEAIYRSLELARYGGSEEGLDPLAVRISRFVEER